MIRNFVFALGIFASACAPTVSPVDAPSDRAIIVVPGFKGSALADRNGDRVWISVGESVYGSRSLALPAPGVRNPITLHPDGVLDEVTSLGIFGTTVYGPFFDTLRQRCRNVHVIPFAYDWRLSNVYSARRLAALIVELRGRGITKIDVVGHSMGGLILAWYLRFGSGPASDSDTQWLEINSVSRVVFAGTPFLGSLKILHDMKFGNVTGFNARLLDPQALASFPSSYELLPYSPVTRDELYRTTFWQQHNLGLFRSVELGREKQGFVQAQLDSARVFHETLLAGAPVTAELRLPSALVVRGTGRSTPQQYTPAQQTTDSRFLVDATNSDGDGIVTAESAQLPTPFRKQLDVREVSSAQVHERLLEDDAVASFLCPTENFDVQRY